MPDNTPPPASFPQDIAAGERAVPALQAHGVSFSYPRPHAGDGTDKRILDAVSFTLRSGSVCALFGPNGSGKSTLLRCCLGLLTPQKGSITLMGKDSKTLRTAPRARFTAYVPQEQNAALPFTVREIVQMGRTPHMGIFHTMTRADTNAVENAMERCGVRRFADVPFSSLSGGQKQLVSLAKALAQETPLMLLDEPASALDLSNQLLFWEILRNTATQGTAVLVCCHDPNHVLWFCHEAVILSHGKVIASGKSENVLTEKTLHGLYGGSVRLAQAHGSPVLIPARLE